MKPTASPLSVALQAARANLLPGLLLQGAMLALLLAYFFYPPAQGALARLSAWKEEAGYGFSFVAGALAGGLLPELFRVFVLRRGPRWRPGGLAFDIFFWGGQAMIVDGFYRAQAMAFGTEVTFAVVFKKVLVDQLIYTPFFAVPVAVVVYEARERGWSAATFRGVFTPAFLRAKAFPSLVANWCLWVPVVAMVYSLPPLLQIPFFTVAMTFWVMIFTWIQRERV